MTGQEFKPNFADYTPRICQSSAARASYAEAAGKPHWRTAFELSKSSQTEPMTSFMADPDQLLNPEREKEISVRGQCARHTRKDLCSENPGTGKESILSLQAAQPKSMVHNSEELKSYKNGSGLPSA